MRRQRTQSAALEATITAAGDKLGPQHSALLALLRLHAAQIDAAGPDASTRLSAAYLSGLKDLARVIGKPSTLQPGGTLARLRSAESRTRRSA